MKLKYQSGWRLASTAHDQDGVVSTYVSMGIIGILSLIAVSFALLMQTEFTQARERQLNTQARIAAEAAINDARKVVYKAIGNRLNLTQFIAAKDSNGDGVVDGTDTGVTTAEISFYDASGNGVVDIDDDILQRPYDTVLIEEWYDCGDTGLNRGDEFEGDLDDSGSNVEYTCVEVDGRPVKLVYDNINTDRSENVLIQTRMLEGTAFHKSNVDKLVINWQGATGAPNPDNFKTASVHQQRLPPERLWGNQAPVPMLRIQIIPLNIRDGWTRSELNESTRTYYLYPTEYDASGCIDKDSRIALYSSWSVGATPSPNCPGATIAPTPNNRIVNADCDGDGERACTVEISGLSGGNPSGTCSNTSHTTQAACTAATETWTPYSTNNEKGITGDKTPTNMGQKVVNKSDDGVCSDPSHTTQAACTAATETWTAPNPANDEMVYIVLVRSIYGDVDLAISAQNSDGYDLRFVNQQINVTATGRAGGLTYRLREVIPIRPKYNRPEYAVDSAEHICKILIGEPDRGVSWDHDLIAGSYSNPVEDSLGDAADQAFCEELHPS